MHHISPWLPVCIIDEGESRERDLVRGARSRQAVDNKLGTIYDETTWPPVSAYYWREDWSLLTDDRQRGTLLVTVGIYFQFGIKQHALFQGSAEIEGQIV